jgi:hypothetical protein
LRGFLSIGPFAAALTAYGLLLDHLQDKWFAFESLKYVFSGLGSLSIGLGLKLLSEQLIKDGVSGGDDALATDGEGPTSAEKRTAIPIAAKLQNCSATIIADLRSETSGGRDIYGWSQYIGDKVLPTAIGSAYGLRIAMSLDIRHHALDRHALVRSLLAMQKPGGGWAASTQRDAGRPEVTAWVLAALCRCGLDKATKSELVEVLHHLIKGDEVGLNRATIVSTILSALAEVSPNSRLVRDLAYRLIEAANYSPNGASWGEVFTSGGRESVPHTARVVVALNRAAPALQDDSRLSDTVKAGVTWLCQDSLPLSNTDEQIRRPMGDGMVDVLLVGHFTPALMARALLQGETSDIRDRQLRRAVGEVMDSQRSGIWTWHDGRKPIWMAYQGITVLKEYGLSGLPWPP